MKDVISARTARTMTAMLREVVLHGTAIAASTMKYPLAGKTGTTNNFTDAWFVGFSPFDHLRSVDRLRREEISGSKRNRSPRGITHLDGLHEGCAGGKRCGRFPGAARSGAKSDAAPGRHARHSAGRR